MTRVSKRTTASSNCERVDVTWFHKIVYVCVCVCVFVCVCVCVCVWE